MTRITPRLLLGSVALLVLCGLPAASRSEDKPANQPVDLRPHFQAGRTARYELWTAMQSTVDTRQTNQQPKIVNNRMLLTGQVTWTVEHVRPDGGASCIMTMDWLRAVVSADGGPEQVNDTRQSTGSVPAVHQRLRAMTGVPMRFEVSADGTIERLIGGDAIRRNAGEGGESLSDNQLMQNAGDLATIPGALANMVLGQGWEQNSSWPHQAGTLHQSMRYSLSGVEDIAGIPVATVTGNANVRLEVDAAKLQPPAGAPPINVSLTSAQVSTQIMYDLQRHEAVGRNSLSNMQFQIKAQAENINLVSTITEVVQSQALRIGEK